MISEALLSILVSYLSGSIPSAYIAGRLAKGIDIREVGDRNMGAANALREVGFLPGVLVLLVDVGKGMAAVVFSRWLGVADITVLIAGVAAVMGHNYPIFLEFRGGRGAATALGVLLALLPREILLLFGLAAIPFAMTFNFVLAIGLIFGPLFLVAWRMDEPEALVAFSIVLPILVGIRHFMTTRELSTSIQGSPSYSFGRLFHYGSQRENRGTGNGEGALEEQTHKLNGEV